MPDPLASSRTEAVSAATSIVTALAEETHAPIALVKSLYDREVAVLEAQARIKNFISVLACKRVKRQLKTPQRSEPTSGSLLTHRAER